MIGIIKKINLPKPFTPKTWDRENSPMNEDANLSFIIPSWKRSRVYGFPGGLIFAHAISDHAQ